MIPSVFRYRFGLIIIATGLLAGGAFASEICANSLDPNAPQIVSLIREYRKILRSKDKPSAQSVRISELLNQIFYPMAIGLEQKVKSLSDEDIQKLAATIGPIKRGQYKRTRKIYSGLQVAKIPTSTVTKHVQEMIDGNASQGSLEYGFQNHPQTVKMNEFLYIEPNRSRIQKMGIAHQQLGLLITPIGDYGEAFARRQLVTTYLLSLLAEQNLDHYSKLAYQSNTQLLVATTARAEAASVEDSDPNLAPLSSFIEGVISYNQLLGIMLAEKIPGVEESAVAVEAFTKRSKSKIGLTAAVTAQIPFGLVGPMNLSGFGFRRPLKLNSSGFLELSDEVDESLRQFMKIQTDLVRPQGICPFALFFRKLGSTPTAVSNSKPAGLQVIAESYLRVFNAIH